MTSERSVEIGSFLRDTGWADAEQTPVAGDASTRRYLRLTQGKETAVLMDSPAGSDGPPVKDGLPYSRIAHLAEDCRPFVAVGEALRKLGLSAPKLLKTDISRGLLLMEDLGDALYGPLIVGEQASTDSLYGACIQALMVLHTAGAPAPLPVSQDEHHVVPEFDERVFLVEPELLIDWYQPALTGAVAESAERDEYLDIWRRLYPAATGTERVLMLRDFHSPNLIWLPERKGAARAGLIDYQDALVGPPAYDLASLLKDARIDVPREREEKFLELYIAERLAADATFDSAAFRASYAIVGAQRLAKIIGIFARLWKRDGKPRYLAHLPRLWRYMDACLEHPDLSDLKAWCDRHLPRDLRAQRLPGAPD